MLHCTTDRSDPGQHSRDRGGPHGGESAIVIPTQPESPSNGMRSPTAITRPAPSWLPPIHPLPRSRFPFFQLLRLFTAQGGHPSSSVFDSFLALSFAMHSTADLRGALARHHSQPQAPPPYDLPNIFTDILALMDQVGE